MNRMRGKEGGGDGGIREYSAGNGLGEMKYKERGKGMESDVRCVEGSWR